MKRALAILLTFITLAAGALFAPAATADGNFKTELWFTLNSDGSIKELVNVSSNDNTINADNCKGTETDIVRFTRIGKENRCIFIKYYKKGEPAPNWSVSSEGNSINFRFFNEFYYSLDKITNTLNIDRSDLNVSFTIVQLPADTTITSQTLSPRIDKGDSRYSYYTWFNDEATSEDIELTGSFSYSPYDPTGRPTTSTPSQTNKPSHTPTPFSTASSQTSRGTTSSAATTSPTAGRPTTGRPTIKSAPGTNKSAFTSISNSGDFNGVLNEFLIVAAIVSIVIIVGTFLLARISKNSTSAYTPLSAATLYDDRSSSSTQPQTYQTNSNQPRSFTDNQASTQPGHSGRQTQVSSHPGKDSQTDLNSTHKL